MPDDPMNDEELSDDEFGGYLPCEEMETCEDLVPCEEIPNQEFDVFTDNFICDTPARTATPTYIHQPAASTTQLCPTITTTPTTTSHDTPQGHACTVDIAGKSVLDFKLLINDEILSSIADHKPIYMLTSTPVATTP